MYVNNSHNYRITLKPKIVEQHKLSLYEQKPNHLDRKIFQTLPLNIQKLD